MPKVRVPLFVLLGIAILFVCVASSVTSWLITYSYSRNALLDISKSLRNEISMEMSYAVTSLFEQPKALLYSMQNAIFSGLIDAGQAFPHVVKGDSKSKIRATDPGTFMHGMAKRLGTANIAYLLNEKGFFWLGSGVSMLSVSNCTAVIVNGTCLRTQVMYSPNNVTLTIINTTYDASTRPWYTLTPRTPGHFSLTPIFVQMYSGKLMTTSAQALFNNAGEYQATIALDARVEEDLSAQLRNFNVSNKTLLFILQDEPRLPFIANRNGNCTNPKNKDLLMGVYESENEEIKKFGIDLRDKHYPVTADRDSYETDNYAWEVRRVSIGGLGMLICVGLDKKELMEPIAKGNTLTTILVTVVTAALVFLGMGCGWMIARSLMLLCEVLRQAAEMQVEDYSERRAFISEVHVIQQCVGRLMRELKEYKSYMPAALFKGDSDNEDERVPVAVDTTGNDSDSDTTDNRSKTTKSSGHTNRASVTQAPSKRRRGSVSTDGSANSASKAYKKSKHYGLASKDVSVMCVTAINFVERLQQFDTSTASQLLNRMFDAVHSVAASKKGHIELATNGQIIVSWNAQTRCCEHADMAATCALQLKNKLEELYLLILSDCGTSCRFTIALASGQALCGIVGNDAQRAITTLGVPVAACQTTANCVEDLHSDVLIICDPTASSRLKYSFVLKPIDTLLYAHLKKSTSYRQPITLFEILHHKATGKDAEWMYQLQDMEQGQSEYNKLFNVLSSGDLDISKSISHVDEYLVNNDTDRQATRLGEILEKMKSSGGNGLLRTVVPWKLCNDLSAEPLQVSVL